MEYQSQSEFRDKLKKVVNDYRPFLNYSNVVRVNISDLQRPEPCIRTFRMNIDKKT